MLTLCIDTSFRYLGLALIKDDEIIASHQEDCLKKLSESIFVVLDDLFKTSNISPQEIDAICIAKGPGSYTGVRIAMTIAKTLAQVSDIQLYTISTLQLYAANASKTMVIMDARAERAHVGAYDTEKTLIADCVMPLADIDTTGYELVGDLHLLGKEDKEPDIAVAFLKTKSSWQRIEEVAYLTPEYLKATSDYKR